MFNSLNKSIKLLKVILHNSQSGRKWHIFYSLSVLLSNKFLFKSLQNMYNEAFATRFPARNNLTIRRSPYSKWLFITRQVHCLRLSRMPTVVKTIVEMLSESNRNMFWVYTWLKTFIDDLLYTKLYWKVVGRLGLRLKIKEIFTIQPLDNFKVQYLAAKFRLQFLNTKRDLPRAFGFRKAGSRWRCAFWLFTQLFSAFFH